jgi:hypothetical protein
MADIDDEIFDLVKLDRTRHGARVTPPENGAHWEQDGFYFDNEGRLAPAWLTEKDKDRLRRKAARAKASNAAEAARRKALIAAGIDPDQEEDDAGNVTAKSAGPAKAPAEAGKSDAVDLLAWARGELKAPWFKVRAAFEAQHAVSVENKEDAMIFLVKAGLMVADEVKA